MPLNAVEKLNDLADTISGLTILNGGSYSLAIRSFSSLVKLVATSRIISQSYEGAVTHTLEGELVGKHSYKVTKMPGYGYGPGEFHAEILIEAYALFGEHASSVRIILKGPRNNDDLNRVEIVEVSRQEKFSHPLSKAVELWAFRHYLQLSKFEAKLAS